MKLRYTPRALAELDSILDYIRQRSPSGATRGYHVCHADLRGEPVGPRAGAWIGGLALTAGLPYGALPMLGLAIILAAAVTLMARREAEAVLCCDAAR